MASCAPQMQGGAGKEIPGDAAPTYLGNNLPTCIWYSLTEPFSASETDCLTYTDHMLIMLGSHRQVARLWVCMHVYMNVCDYVYECLCTWVYACACLQELFVSVCKKQMCMIVHVYPSLCAWSRVHVDDPMSQYMFIQMSKHMCLSACMHFHMWAWVHACIMTCVYTWCDEYVCIHECMCTCALMCACVHS